MMKHQKGAVTLLYTAMLLIAILTLSIASYKNVFLQAKRAQNEITSRQQHWAAEGGLECAFAVNRSNTGVDLLNQDYSNCTQSSLEFSPNTSGSTFYTVTSKNVKSEVKKIIKMPKAAGLAAITANADMILLGNYDVQPNPINKNTVTNRYECLSVNYSQKFTFLKDKYNTNAEYHTMKPYDPSIKPANAANTVYCEADYITNITTTETVDREKNTPSEIAQFKKDFLYTSGLDPFKKIFGVARSDFQEIKSHFDVISNPTNCSAAVNSQISASKELIWVEGNCDISSINSSNTQGIILVVQNGLLALGGSAQFNGVLYHFINTTFTPTSSDWSSLGSTANTSYLRIDESASEVGISVDIPSAIIQGSALPQGSLIIDTPNNLALIDGSATISFDQLKIDHPLKTLLKPKWLKGSWHDF
ncbi:hypothetical protein HC723_03620 [Vibrio sp. S11_S32]|uniref:hypothetical protein n=1 Tax=Vibrio sp. S11_S32 TaxID=2720225 RepID=UPI0016817A54|nr:hypothetical protein [Vibrio sp. S11_S32]MBD1575544.1 hypothetical protein [Vibrio sp. S11_S32]